MDKKEEKSIMSGKPNLPIDSKQFCIVQGASMMSNDLDALDQERGASMADEGGLAGALMENQANLDPRYLSQIYFDQSKRFSIRRLVRKQLRNPRTALFASATVLFIGVIAYGALKRRKKGVRSSAIPCDTF
jgi:hypothetical protein